VLENDIFLLVVRYRGEYLEGTGAGNENVEGGSFDNVEFVIQILKKAAKLASEAEARRRKAWAGAQIVSLLVLGFHLYNYLCKPQEIIVGAKAKTPPFARGLRRTRCTNGDKTTGRLTLRLIRRRRRPVTRSSHLATSSRMEARV
jgi:hypothetical protein